MTRHLSVALISAGYPPHLSEGIHVQTYDLAQALSSEGANVTVFCGGAGAPALIHEHEGILSFSPGTVALLYMSTYLGYLIAPTHLCFIFTADYFKCSLGKVYKYLIPSFLISFTTALLIYFLV